MAESEDPEIYIAYDCDLRRPGCVLLQAAMGGNAAVTGQLFDSETWLLAPTPGLVLRKGTLALWKRVAEITAATAPKKDT
jgi:hypothetical protein